MPTVPKFLLFQIYLSEDFFIIKSVMKIRKTCLNKQILKGLRPVTKNTQIFKMTNIGRLTFLLLFFTLEIHEKSTKNEEQQCDVTQVVLVKNLVCQFSFKVKDQTILFKLAGILKNNLRLFQLDSNTLLECHSVLMSTK